MSDLAQQISYKNQQRLAAENNLNARLAAAKAGKSEVVVKPEIAIPPEGLPVKDWEKLLVLVGMVVKEIKSLDFPKTKFPQVQHVTGNVTTDLVIPDTVTIDNLKPLMEGLTVIAQEIRAIKVNPEVKVSVPKSSVKVDSPVVNVELKSLEKKLDQVVKSLKDFRVEIPETIIPDFPHFETDKDGNLIVTVANMISGGGGAQAALPLAKYKAADLDDDASPNYYGFLAPDRDWYILKEDTTAKTFRYVSGSGGYAGNWTNRVNLSYVLLSEAF